MAPGREGHGLSNEVSLTVPPGSLGYWSKRLGQHRARTGETEVRFGQNALPLVDPHGLRLALVESDSSLGHAFAPWDTSPVPAENQIRGLESARMIERDLVVTTSFLTHTMGFAHLGTEHGWHRYGVAMGKSGAYIDLRESPLAGRGAWGTGSVHHIAWRVEDEKDQLEVRASVSRGGAHPTPVINRCWFKSVYFREPGGVLFELATEGPGFAVDEDQAHLGEKLVLPPWLEPDRGAIESRLPELTAPRGVVE
jgi:glyoxalase family protein